MKKILFTAIVLVSTITTVFSAATNNIDDRVRLNFSYAFPDAEKRNPTKKAGMTKVDAEVDGKIVSSYYDYSGDLVATTQKISFDELPLTAKRNFAKKYGSFTVTEAVKFESPEETAYYLSFESEKGTQIIKVSKSSEVSFFKEIKM